MSPDALNALGQVGFNADKNDPEVASLIKAYDGKEPVAAIVAVLNSARNKELRRKAGEYDKIKPQLDDAQNWKSYAINILLPQLEKLEEGADGATAKKLAQLQNDVQAAVNKSKE